jgi:ABC-type multidrug transport system fused ATPase/permease subunit
VMLTSVRSKLQQSIVLRSLKVIPAENRKKVVLATFLQVGLAVLDLIGVAAIGILGALSVTGIQSQQPGDRTLRVLELLQIESFSFQTQVAILGLSACVIFIFRTMCSIIITRRVLFFLSRQGAQISIMLLNKILGQSLLKIQSRSTQEIIYSLSGGVTAIILGVVATTVALIADASLMLILLFALVSVDYIMAVTSVLFFGLMGFALYRSMNARAQELGEINSQLIVMNNEKIIEVLDSYREAVVRNTRQNYVKEITAHRFKLADTLAEMQFMPNVSKYVIESGMIVGAVLIAGVQFAIYDAPTAVATLSVFMAAGTRLGPAVLRIQQNLIQIKGSAGLARPTLLLVDSLSDSDPLEAVKTQLNRDHADFVAEAEMSDISFTYPGQEVPALRTVSLTVKSGESMAIVGPSGSGKSTLVDVLLGLLNPDEGEVMISKLSPRHAIENWAGAVAYVPQNVAIMNGTIRENVTLGYPVGTDSDEFVHEALRLAQLSDLIKEMPAGLDTNVGERGAKLSGGQRQRLGIARALFTNPKMLVLDEATSSLDGQTESDLSAAINSLHGHVTVVLIAHRLPTVRAADQVLYLAAGEIIARGSFEEVRNVVPDFDTQAELSGM